MKKNKSVEQNLRNAVSASVPDVLDDILSKCQERKGKVISMDEIKAANKKRRIKSICATAAAVAIIVVGTLGFGQYQKAQAQEYTITIEAQQGVEIVVDRNDRVKDIKALGQQTEEFKKQLESFEAQQLKKGDSAQVTVEKLISFLAENGNIKETAKPVNISVDGKDTVKSADLEKTLTALITKVLESSTQTTPGSQTTGGKEGAASSSDKVQVSKDEVLVVEGGTSVKVDKNGVSVTDESIFGGTNVEVKGGQNGGATVKVTDDSPFSKTEVEVVIPSMDPTKQTPGEMLKALIDANLENALKYIEK